MGEGITDGYTAYNKRSRKKRSKAQVMHYVAGKFKEDGIDVSYPTHMPEILAEIFWQIEELKIWNARFFLLWLGSHKRGELNGSEKEIPTNAKDRRSRRPSQQELKRVSTAVQGNVQGNERASRVLREDIRFERRSGRHPSKRASGHKAKRIPSGVVPEAGKSPRNEGDRKPSGRCTNAKKKRNKVRR